MSDSLPKPTSVKVGQWWLVPEHPLPHCVLSVDDGHAFLDTGPIDPGGSYSTTLPIDFVLVASEYLGTNANPPPSAWMVERLVEHGHYAQSGEPLGDLRRVTANERVRELLQGAEPTNYFDRAVLSLYRILRDLGKW